MKIFPPIFPLSFDYQMYLFNTFIHIFLLFKTDFRFALALLVMIYSYFKISWNSQFGGFFEAYFCVEPMFSQRGQTFFGLVWQMPYHPSGQTL